MSVGTNQSLPAKGVCVFECRCVLILAYIQCGHLCCICSLTPVCAHICVSSAFMYVIWTSHPGFVPGGLCPDGRGSVKDGGLVLEVAGQLGGCLMGPGTGPVARHQAH